MDEQHKALVRAIDSEAKRCTDLSLLDLVYKLLLNEGRAEA